MVMRTGSRGELHAQVVGSCEDYGIDEGSVSIIIRTFMELKTDTLVHLIDVVNGVLVFAHSDPANPHSGVIYVYDKQDRTFWGLDFEKDADDLTRKQFEDIAEEYGLSDLAARPALLSGLAKVGKA
jgi:hypothetical protein